MRCCDRLLQRTASSEMLTGSSASMASGVQFEPGTFPLAHAGTFRNRVAELRGSGNALNLAQARGFVEALMEIL